MVRGLGAWRAECWRPASRCLLIPALIAVALALSGCLFESAPRTPAPPTATATPRPTPTETPAALPILQPTFAPTRPPRPTAPVPTLDPDVRAGGQILYLASQAGRRDILSVEGNGQGRQRLVTGTYEAPVWSPDGSRFAAFGATVDGGLSDQLAIFDGNGRPVARYPLAGVGAGALQWSADGRAILCLLRDPTETRGVRTAWVSDDDGLRRVPLPDDATPWRWAPGGRLAYLVYPPGGPGRVSQSSPLAVWSVDLDGGQARKEAEGTIAPLGWSADGGTFYAFDGLLNGQGGQQGTRATTLIAIDRRSGTTRTTITAASVAGGGRGPGAGVAWFEGGQVAPAGGELVVWLRVVVSGATPASTPTAGAGGAMVVALVDETGRVLARDPLRAGEAPAGFSWSPGGLLLAYVASGGGAATLRILKPSGQEPIAYPVSALVSPFSSPPSWSPDSRWLAAVGPTGLTIVAAVGDPRAVVLVEGTALLSPVWRPTLNR